MKITVPPDIERSLTARANQLGTTPELLALDSLRERFPPPSESAAAEEAPERKAPQNLADFLRGYVGVLHSSELVAGGAGMSEDAREKFAAGLLKKRRAGRL
jgi:hypothetical protein